MFTTAPLFGKFHSPLKKAAQPLQRRHPLHYLESLCAPWIDPALLATNPTRANSRQRLYPPTLTFMAFLDQVLHPGASCRAAVRQIQAYYQNLPAAPSLSSDTAAYCEARARWTLDELEDIRRHLATHSAWQSLPGSVPGDRPIKVIDGTCVNAAESPANRAQYPQSASQLPECGFPLLRLVATFSLQTGMLLERQSGPYTTSEIALYQQLWPTFQPGDIVLGDRLFGFWGAIASLRQQGVDGIFHLPASRNADFRQGQYLGPNDRLLTIAKPRSKSVHLTQEQWAALPATLTLRMVRFGVPTRNGRCKKITLLTSLLDPKVWPVSLLAALYGRRWQIELFLRDIKTTLQMEMLSCQSPAMVQKELEMHLIAYNLIRALMGEAALTCHVPLQRLSFKGTLDTARQFGAGIARIPVSYHRRRKAMYLQMLAVIAGDPVPERHDRFEPRCQKKRPKAYPFMTSPRRVLKATRKDSLTNPTASRA